MNTTPSPAREAVELPEPDAFKALKLVPFEYRWFHVRENATKLGYEIEELFYSEKLVRALLAAKQEEVDRMRRIAELVIHATENRAAKDWALMNADLSEAAELARTALSPIQGAAHEIL